MQEYGNEITKYLQSVNEQNILLLQIRGMYTIVITEVLAQIAKDMDKCVNVIGIEPCIYWEGVSRKIFVNVWQHIEEICDKTIFYHAQELIPYFEKEDKLHERNIKANKIMLHSFYEKYQSCNESIYTNNIVFQQ
ncbi:hypothetical protein MLC52_09815 [Sulfurimonas sp. NW15]|uniref:hypothetical protein n=1 Tax=Sulfurimonas sp. NW15 TaxID=2922729 RepID=UPI003DA906C1